MLAKKPTGRNSSVFKYDLLTVVGAYALSADKGRQRLVLRLMTLITARYNWAKDELAVGQREIARLWKIDERSVKREMAKLRAMEWLVVRRAGARGRVTEYGLGIDRILLDTQSRWQDVGPDLEFRLSGAPEPSDTNIVPLPSRKVAMTLPNIDDGKEWSLAAAILYQEDPQCFAAWLAPLRRKGRAGGRLMLLAPSRFHAHYVATHFRERLVTICQSVDAQISDIVIEHD